MKKKLVRISHLVWCALASKEARGPELALARLVLAALGVKLGVNAVDYFK